VEQYNIGSKGNYRKALEKIHINTEAQAKDKETNKQTNNEVMMMMMMITVIAYYITSWTNTI
jgi:hypothetical protein